MLAAFVNSFALFAISGLLVTIAPFWVLSRRKGQKLNVRAAAVHVLSDLPGSVGTIGASLVIMPTRWIPIDPILSVFVTTLILRAVCLVTKERASILIESAPKVCRLRRSVRYSSRTCQG
ncbi:cation transporter [Parvularcula dongshanensis]|uniref:Co/Zn/Cd efflux system component n=1 Tax=Parvularcula dongshanensis TaxID=1173995 RepID=A0A840I4K9_9PROT|nr:Co/Zn/Cd efflux system component [Parvularcula dongshanensis]